MRVLAWLAVAALSACGTRTDSLAGQLQTVHDLLQSERFEAAVALAENGYQRAHRAGDPKLEWRFRLLKAELLVAKRDPAAALATLDERLPDRSDWAEYRGKALLLRAHAAYLLSRYEEAESLIAEAAKTADQAGSPSLAAEVELRRGFLDVQGSRFDSAEAMFREVILAATRLRDPYLEARATGNLGYALMRRSRYDEAIPWFEKAKDLFTKLKARESIARAVGNLGWCYFRLGDFEAARAHFESAEAEFAKGENRYEEQIWLGNVASVEMMQRNFSSAAATYDKALAIARQLHNDVGVSQWLNNLALAYVELGDWGRAASVNREAFAVQQRIPEAHSAVYPLYNAGRIAVAQNRFGDAEKLYRKALEEPANDPTVVLDTHAALADLYSRTGRKARADAQFWAAITSIDSFSSTLLKEEYRLSYLDSLIRLYRDYVDYLMAQGEPRRALEVAESSRSHVLAQKTGRTDAVGAHTAEAYQRLARDTKSVLLEYWLGEERSYLWAVTPGRIQYYELPPAGGLRPLLESYRAVTMAGRDPLQAAGETGRKLYEALLAPAANELCAGCRIVVVPDQDLYSINLETLPAAPGGRLWIEQANVRIAPSLSYLLEAARERRAASGKSLLVLGDPVVSLPEYPKLEYASREIESITSSVGGAGAAVVKGADARPDSYRQSQPGHFGLIHFSAHATANAQSPLDSAVILSGPPDRCKLFARDVMAVPLNAELVTISACQSAGAKTYAGEGLVGFAWAFLRAGARNVIAGLWDVNDRSTEQLMSRLYAEVARGSTPGDALRSAKLALIHGGGSYAKPYYWAPFQVYSAAIE